MKNSYKLAAVLLGALAVLPAGLRAGQEAAAPVKGYRLVRTIPLPGEGSWDYLTADSAARRLYVTRGSTVEVVDMDSFTIVGELDGTNGVHGVAIAPEFGRAFTSNGRAGTVGIFDTASLRSLGETKAGKGPDAILYDPASRSVFAFNGRDNSATVVDAASGAVKATIALGGRPESAAADGKGRVYLNLEDKSAVAVIDSLVLAVTAQWTLSPCEEPSGMAIDAANSRLFIGCSNKMMAVMDAGSGVVVSTVPIGAHVDANAFDPATALAFSSNGDGTLTVVHEDSPAGFTVRENVVTQNGARTMALDLKTHRVFLITADYGPAPAPTPEHPRTRPQVLPGTIRVLVMEK